LSARGAAGRHLPSRHRELQRTCPGGVDGREGWSRAVRADPGRQPAVPCRAAAGGVERDLGKDLRLGRASAARRAGHGFPGRRAALRAGSEHAMRVSYAAIAVLLAVPVAAQPPAADAPVNPLNNTIKWSTASEVDNF